MNHSRDRAGAAATVTSATFSKPIAGKYLAVLFIWFWAFLPGLSAGIAAAADYYNADILQVKGAIQDPHGNGVADVEITLSLKGGDQVERFQVLTDAHGEFGFEELFPAGTIAGAGVFLQARKISYAPSARIHLSPIRADIPGKSSSYYLAQVNLTLRRTVSPALWISAAVLMVMYVLIGFEIIHRTLAAILGATLLLGITYLAGPFFPEFRIITFEAAARAVDLNVILLLLAMMIIVGVSETSGMFQWLAFRCYRLAGGRPGVLVAALMAVTALTSAFLDNVTTMLLVIPVSLRIAAALRVNPIALLLPEVFASNIGGTATLIGDPPNIMIGSYAGLTFADFIANLVLPCGAILVISMVYFRFYFRGDLAAASRVRGKGPESQQVPDYRITDTRILVLSLIFLAMTISLFLLQGLLGMAPCIAALIGATGLLLAGGVDIVDILEKKIEWPTLIFFAMLFVVVAAAEESGLIFFLAEEVKSLAGDSMPTAILLILWGSALASAFIDNIPFTATMLPVVGYMTASIAGAQDGLLWWALVLGACLGGNGTLIGASANVVTAGMAEKAGTRISFGRYFRICFAPMILSVLFCTFWLLVVP